MRVLVCGGRDFADSALLYGVLDELNRAKTIICVIEGDARGADRLAGHVAVSVPSHDSVITFGSFSAVAGAYCQAVDRRMSVRCQ
jgi:YspA, cpYpsA-related SLOG family